ncbi:MAG: NAD(P)H-quinone oxidoreductase [Lysobacterales bacterium]|jgi:putative PIG3 family NAD(P)H quinone oxidoreductase|nr:MAG: NAD(P)H-quinone oxidoreductase [Xanthomonadales bacterium]
MRAVGVRGGQGAATDLEIQVVPRPRPAPGQVLIRVRAAGVNRPDILQRQGRYPPPPGAPLTLGLEVAGEVAEIGEGASRWKPGDAVTALLPGGGYAEYAVVDERHALPVPPGYDFVRAAALPETVFTVWANVFERGRLQPGETLLVHGANSGIGVTAIQMAKAAGASVVATARGAEKVARAREIGADLAVDAAAGDWSGPVRAAGPVHVVLDMVGASYFAQNIDVLAPDGRLVVIAVLTGATVELNLLALMMKRLTLTGSTLRARDAAEKARLATAIEEHVWPWLESGRVKVPVDRVFPLERAGEAHTWLEQGQQFGKVVLAC